MAIRRAPTASPRQRMVALAAGLVFVINPLTPAGAEQRTDVVSASVVPGSLTDPHGSFFVLPSQPGQVFEQSVLVMNPYDHQLLVDVAGVDALTAAQTGASYRTPGTPAVGTGRWISVAQRQLLLSAGERRTVSFRVSVPVSTRPGQYLAGVSIAVAPNVQDASATPQGNQAGFAMGIRAQRVIAVEVDVAGDRAPDLVVRGATAVARSDMINLAISIANRGNAFAHGDGAVTVSDTGLNAPFNIDTFVSHTEISMLVPWTRNAAVGAHPIRVELRYEGGRRSSWSGTIQISEELRARLNRELAPGVSHSKSNASSNTRLLQAGGGVAAVTLCSACALHLRRRRNMHTIAMQGS